MVSKRPFVANQEIQLIEPSHVCEWEGWVWHDHVEYFQIPIPHRFSCSLASNDDDEAADMLCMMSRCCSIDIDCFVTRAVLTCKWVVGCRVRLFHSNRRCCRHPHDEESMATLLTCHTCWPNFDLSTSLDQSHQRQLSVIMWWIHHDGESTES